LKVSIFFYQTHPSLLIRGVRPTISRFNNYGLYEHITPDTIALTGGIVLYYYKIAILTKEYLEIKNVELINVDINEFQTTKNMI